jgi:hypothetical protein
MFNPRLTSGLPTSMTNMVQAAPVSAPVAAPMAHQANGPAPQMLPARQTAMPVGRGPSGGLDAGGIGMDWQHSPTMGRRAI